ncbi:hypothetical protein QF027_009784 [Streptomyces canus]|nr:hypothetical protein [Streptomyces canus]
MGDVEAGSARRSAVLWRRDRCNRQPRSYAAVGHRGVPLQDAVEGCLQGVQGESEQDGGHEHQECGGAVGCRPPRIEHGGAVQTRGNGEGIRGKVESCGQDPPHQQGPTASQQAFGDVSHGYCSGVSPLPVVDIWLERGSGRRVQQTRLVLDLVQVPGPLRQVAVGLTQTISAKRHRPSSSGSLLACPRTSAATAWAARRAAARPARNRRAAKLPDRTTQAPLWPRVRALRDRAAAPRRCGPRGRPARCDDRS